MQRRWLGALAIVLAIGCANRKPIIPPDRLWTEANGAFKDEAYEIAVERYKMLLDQHPFDANAEEAELKIAQSYFLSRRYAEAIAAFGDFERQHPTSPSLPLVEYHLGLSYLAQASTPDRDPQPDTNALLYFRNIVDRFPNTPWAEKAQLRLRECREALADHEAGITVFYLKRGNMRAAESRLRSLLLDYPETEATAGTLDHFVRAYTARKETVAATLALATLARHHPDGPFGRDALKQLQGEPAALTGPDPLPLLVAHLDQVGQQADRQQVPHTVSAYPDAPPGSAPAY